MKLTTKINIPFEDWLNQVKRFADYDYSITLATLPKDLKKQIEQGLAEYSKAEISIDIKSLTYPKFDGIVTYTQVWNTFTQSPTFDETTGEQNGTEPIAQPNKKVVLAYKLTKSYEEIQAILDAVEPLIDVTLTGKAKLEAQVMKAVELDVVGHHTFVTSEYPNGLPAEQYAKSF